MKPHLRITIETLLKHGVTQREIERRTGVDRKTIRRHIKSANSPGVATGSEGAVSEIRPPRPPALEAGSAKATPPYTSSACEPHRAWIEAQVQLGRNAQSIYRDLVDGSAFTHRYNSVKRFVAALKLSAPARFDVLEFLPGEEAQVDYGQGALTRYRPGKYKRPLLVHHDAEVLGQEFPQGGVEEQSGSVGTAARGSLACVWRLYVLRRVGQPEGRGHQRTSASRR